MPNHCAMTNCHLRFITPGMEHTAPVREAPKSLDIQAAREVLRGLRLTFRRSGYDVRPLHTLDEGFEAVRGSEQVSIYIHVAEVRAVEYDAAG